MTRLALSFALLGLWLVLLFSGWVLGGALHLLLIGALILFPWRAAAAGSPEERP